MGTVFNNEYNGSASGAIFGLGAQIPVSIFDIYFEYSIMAGSDSAWVNSNTGLRVYF